jgi:hypothetical protein
VFNPLGAFTYAGTIDGGSDLDLAVYTPIPGVSVAECQLLDPSCQIPTAQQITDDGGVAHFETNGAFAGFFRFGGAEDAGLVPVTFYPGSLLNNVAETTFPTFMLTYAGEEGFAATGLPAAIDGSPGSPGNANIEVFDCQDHHAAGVEFSSNDLSSGALIYYVKGGVPSTSATQTDSYGTGGINNVSSLTSLTVNATLAATATPIGSVTFPIHPGALTIAWIRPRARAM